MKFHKLRITWSVAWGVVAVFLVVLWVRSYWWTDSVNCLIPNRREISIGSFRGYVQFFESDRPARGANYSYSGLLIDHVPETSKIDAILFESQERTCILGRFYYRSNSSFGTTLSVPIWFAVLAAVGLAAVSWIPWHPLRNFSLRTLLLATTLVAVGMGIIAYALK